MFYVLLLFENSCKDVYLPDLANWSGSILLTSGETRWKQDVSIPVRVLDGNGYIACPAGFSWEDKAIRAKEVPIRNRLGVIISKNSMQIKIQFIASKLNDTVFKKYLLPKEGRVDIGRDTGCTIVLADSTISSHHCVIKIDKGGYYLEDKSSHMASFVNGMGMRDGNIRLQSGDIITLPSGYKIVFLGSIIAINNHSHIQSVKLNPAAMRVDVQAQLSEDRPLPEMIRYHHRMVRVVDRRDEEQIEIEAPISKNEHNEPPLLLTLGPSMTMILPMGLSILVQGRAWTGLIMIGGSSILAVMWGFINARYRRKTERETETKRRNIYVKYIAEMDELLRGKYEKEYTIRLNEKEAKIIEFISKKLANGKRIHELEMFKRLLNYEHSSVFARLETILQNQYKKSPSEKQRKNTCGIYGWESSQRRAYCCFLQRLLSMRPFVFCRLSLLLKNGRPAAERL